MKILHTSDWHLGKVLYNQKRNDEFTRFFDWLILKIDELNVNALIIAGDIFDSSAPSNNAQELYYSFLAKLLKTNLRHVIVIAGNHDSPSFLAAPQLLLKSLNIHVVAEASDNPADEIITLCNDEGMPELIVAAVPFLRDRNVRKVVDGETAEMKTQNLINGIAEHYKLAANEALKLNESFDKRVPVVATGHLFTSNDRSLAGDGVRELYVGSLVHLSEDRIPDVFDYVALGHLHKPQKVGNKDHIRYSGSPIPIGFGELNQPKIIITIEWNNQDKIISEIEIPNFQMMRRLSGSLKEILDAIDHLKAEKKSIWLEIEIIQDEVVPDASDILQNTVQDSMLEILVIKNKNMESKILSGIDLNVELDDLSPDKVLEQYLSLHNVPDNQQITMRECYMEILISIEQDDPNKSDL